MARSARRARYSTREMAQVGVFTAVVIATAMLVRYGGAIVPFSLVPFAVILTGAVLGPRLAATTLLVYVLLGLAGLPVFATPPFGGPAYLLKPTFGFLLGYIPAAWLTGWIVHRPLRDAGALAGAGPAARGRERSLARFACAGFAGVGVIYLVGLPWLWLILNVYLGQASSVADVLSLGFLPFVLPDLAKALAAAALARALEARLRGAARLPGRATSL